MTRLAVHAFALACVLATALAPACGHHGGDAPAASASAGHERALVDEVRAIADGHAAEIAALIERLGVLKRGLRGNRAGWEAMLRNAEAANDDLGMPPFTQTVPPGPGWTPSPATLMGIAPSAETRADELAAKHDVAGLQFLVDDVRKRYPATIAKVDHELQVVEHWLATPAP